MLTSGQSGLPRTATRTGPAPAGLVAEWHSAWGCTWWPIRGLSEAFCCQRGNSVPFEYITINEPTYTLPSKRNARVRIKLLLQLTHEPPAQENLPTARTQLLTQLPENYHGVPAAKPSLIERTLLKMQERPMGNPE